MGDPGARLVLALHGRPQHGPDAEEKKAGSWSWRRGQRFSGKLPLSHPAGCWPVLPQGLPLALSLMCNAGEEPGSFLPQPMSS